MQDLGTVKAFSKSDVLDAVARAKAAQAKWKTSSFDQRRHLLHVISRCITENMVCIKKNQHKKKALAQRHFPLHHGNMVCIILYLFRVNLYILFMVYIICLDIYHVDIMHISTFYVGHT